MEVTREQRAEALALNTGYDTSDLLEEQPGDDCLFEFAGSKWWVFTDEEADRAARYYIEDSLWAFKPEFIEAQTGIDGIAELLALAADKCERLNPVVRALIDGTCGLEEFAKSAMQADGRGHFVSHYDGEEAEEMVDGVYFYIYRTN